MAKATYKRKHLIGGLVTVSKGESMTSMLRRMVAGWQIWCWSSSWELTSHQHHRGRERDWVFKTLKLTHPLMSPHLVILPQTVLPIQQCSIKIYECTGIIYIQIFTVRLMLLMLMVIFHCWPQYWIVKNRLVMIMGHHGLTKNYRRPRNTESRRNSVSREDFGVYFTFIFLEVIAVACLHVCMEVIE